MALGFAAAGAAACSLQLVLAGCWLTAGCVLMVAGCCLPLAGCLCQVLHPNQKCPDPENHDTT